MATCTGCKCFTAAIPSSCLTPLPRARQLIFCMFFTSPECLETPALADLARFLSTITAVPTPQLDGSRTKPGHSACGPWNQIREICEGAHQRKRKPIASRSVIPTWSLTSWAGAKRITRAGRRCGVISSIAAPVNETAGMIRHAIFFGIV